MDAPRGERRRALGNGTQLAVLPELDQGTSGSTGVSQHSQSSQSSTGLRIALVVFDALALGASWIPNLVASSKISAASRISSRDLLIAVSLTTAISIGLIASQKLYLARVSSVKAIELARLWRVALLSGVVGAVVLWILGKDPSLASALLRSALAFVFLTIERRLYGGWLGSQRRRGRFTRPVIIVGTNEDGLGWRRLLDAHPELGFRVCGLVGDEDPRSIDPDTTWLGPIQNLREATDATGATGAVVTTTAFNATRLNQIIRDLFSANIHVHISNGLGGISYRRLRPASLARESVFYLERHSLSEWQMRLKRLLDICLASILLALACPVLAVAAVAIWLQDRGPVLFRQERVGYQGQPFTLLKLRTMVVDADRHQAALASHNTRRGPLFKVPSDPRVTSVGRFLRASSIDELPQLMNVMRGEMSLVGPRPALPAETAQFDENLLARHDVYPGITGLWQLEARDNPSFDSYQRLDLYYVENWSIMLDLAIVASTAGSVLARTVRALRRERRYVEVAEARTEQFVLD